MLSESTDSIVTDDGVAIAVTCYQPDTAVAERKGAVVIAAAMSVPQKFYSDFARWLATQGLLAITFDYRGIGQSAPPSLKHYQATIRDWAERDCAAVINYTNNLNRGKPLYWVGHSLGGQIIGLIPNCHLITKAINIASGNGYWRGTVKLQKLASLYMWWVVVPLVSSFCSYFPGRKMRKVGDLPLGVIQEWRRWCLSKNYLLDNVEPPVQQRYNNISFPMTFYALADDEMLSYRAIESAHNFYPKALRGLHQLRPEENGLTKIGHFGFFKQVCGDKLWEKYIAPQLKLHASD